MAGRSDLEEFRKQWERELKHSRRRSDGGSTKSGSKTSSLEVEDCEVVKQVKTEAESQGETPGTSSQKSVELEFLADSDSNSTENYHPFVIVDNLLKNGVISSSNSKYLKSTVSIKQTDLHVDDVPVAQSRSQSNCYFSTATDVRAGNSGTGAGCSSRSDEKPLKRRKIAEDSDVGQSNEKQMKCPQDAKQHKRLLDQLISDLDEITEIPFFDINLPRELALKIFQHLGMIDLCRCCQVSRAWRSLAEDELLWYRVCTELGESKQVTDGEKWKSHAEICVVRKRELIANWKNRVGNLQQLQYIKGGILCHVSSHSDRIVAGYTNCQVKMWQLSSGEECVFQPSSTSLVINEAQEEGTLPNLLTCTATSEILTAAGYTQGMVDIWQNDGSTSPIHTVTCDRTVSHLRLAADQSLVLTSFGPYVRTDFAEGDAPLEQLEILDVNSEVKHIELLKCPEAFQSVNYKSVISTNNIVWLHRPGQLSDTRTEIHNLIHAPITALDVSSTVNQMAIGVSVCGGPTQVCKVKIYCLNSGKLVTTLKGHTYFISCVNLHKSPLNQLVTGCGDRKVRVFDLRSPSPVMTLAAHTQTVSQVQMDDWKVVSGGEDGLTCVWDRRMALKLWDWHNRHPVRYVEFEDSKLYVANVPVEKFPQTYDEFETSLHKRYRGSIQIYDFLSNQGTQGVPENCLSNYDTYEGYDYNIRLAVPYDTV